MMNEMLLAGCRAQSSNPDCNRECALSLARGLWGTNDCCPEHECATRRHQPGGMREPTSGLSQQAGEAGGSLTLEAQGRVGSSPDNDGTDRHRQTIRVRQARRRGTTQVNQWLNPLKEAAGSNLVDVGRTAVHAGRR
jgi:hypothetical protein